jgi:glycosyltransferase involved in cell wall biosynthesis
MNICYLIRSFSTQAGTESYIYHMSIALAKLGHHVHIVSLTGKERAIFIEQENKIFFHHVHFTVNPLTRFFRLERILPFFVWRYGKSVTKVLSDLIEDQAIDIIEATDWGMDAWHYLSERQVPVCVRLHGYPGFKDEFDKKKLKTWPKKYIDWSIQRKHIMSADLVTGVSKSYTDFVRKAWEIRKKDITIIPIAINQNIFHPDEILRENKSILFVGRLEKSKGIETLDHSISMILEIIPEALFYFAGEDRKRDNNQQTWSQYLISKYGKNTIVYLGSIQTTELIRYYQTSTICVVPSLYEPGGTVAFEAMACGCPVIASRVGGLEEVIQDRQTGLLVTPGDASALAGGLTELLQNSQLRQIISQNALESVRKNFDINIIAQQTADAYVGAIKTFNDKRKNIQ